MLEHIRQLNDQILKEVERLKEIRSQAFPGAIRYDAIGGSHATPENKLEDVIARVDHEARKVRLLNLRRKEEKAKAVRIIQRAGLSVEQRHILYLRYLARNQETWENLTWPEVFHWVNLYHNIQRRRMFALHREALIIFREKVEQ